MAPRSKRVTAEGRLDIDAGKVSARYERWLGRQPLAERTREAYSAQVHGFVDWRGRPISQGACWWAGWDECTIRSAPVSRLHLGVWPRLVLVQAEVGHPTCRPAGSAKYDHPVPVVWWRHQLIRAGERVPALDCARRNAETITGRSAPKPGVLRRDCHTSGERHGVITPPPLGVGWYDQLESMRWSRVTSEMPWSDSRPFAVISTRCSAWLRPSVTALR